MTSLLESSTGKCCCLLSRLWLLMLLSVMLLAFFSLVEKDTVLKLTSLSADGARATILERENTYRVVTQVVTQLLEDIGMGDGASLVERIAMVDKVAHKRGMAMARQLVHRVAAMFLSHYPDIDREILVGGWALAYEIHRYPEISAGCVEFTRRVADSASEDQGWLDGEP